MCHLYYRIAAQAVKCTLKPSALESPPISSPNHSIKRLPMLPATVPSPSFFDQLPRLLPSSCRSPLHRIRARISHPTNQLPSKRLRVELQTMRRQPVPLIQHPSYRLSVALFQFLAIMDRWLWIKVHHATARLWWPTKIWYSPFWNKDRFGNHKKIKMKRIVLIWPILWFPTMLVFHWRCTDNRFTLIARKNFGVLTISLQFNGALLLFLIATSLRHRRCIYKRHGTLVISSSLSVEPHSVIH